MKKSSRYQFIISGLLVFLAACALASCQPVVSEFRANIAGEALDFPPGWTTITWLPDGKLLIRPELASVSYAMPGEPIPFLLRDGGETQLRYFPIDSGCMRMEYHVSGVLPNGWLGLVQNCAIHERPNQGPTRVWTNVLAYDWETGDVQQLVAESRPPIGSLTFSWNPDMTRGVQEAGSLLGTIHWITRERAEPMDIIIQDGRRSWSLADNYWRILDRDSETRDIGIACCPSWSPDGQQIAFFASPDAVGRSGISRATGEYKLYLMDVGTLQPVPVLEGLFFAHQLDWSPDGSWLAFMGRQNSVWSEGIWLWLFSPEDRVLSQVSSDPVTQFSWSPDGARIAAARDCLDCQTSGFSIVTDSGDRFEIPACDPLVCRQLVIYDVRSITAVSPATAAPWTTATTP